MDALPFPDLHADQLASTVPYCETETVTEKSQENQASTNHDMLSFQETEIDLTASEVEDNYIDLLQNEIVNFDFKTCYTPTDLQDEDPFKVPHTSEAGIVCKKENLIGRGTFSSVFKSKWLGMTVAVKKVALKHKNTLELTSPGTNEFLLCEGLKHPNIVQVMAFAARKRLIYIISDFIDGQSLDDMLFRTNVTVPLTRNYKHVFATQISSALAYLHSLVTPIIHQDLKPANVLIERRTKVAKVCDFGLGCIHHAVINKRKNTLSRMGTPIFMAPECLLLGIECDQFSDIWSLGCTMVELFAEKPVWDITKIATNFCEHVRIYMQSREHPESLKGVHNLYQNMLRACMDYNPANRPSAQRVYEMLNNFAFE